jgi:hypothetical protein
MVTRSFAAAPAFGVAGRGALRHSGVADSGICRGKRGIAGLARVLLDESSMATARGVGGVSGRRVFGCWRVGALGALGLLGLLGCGSTAPSSGTSGGAGGANVAQAGGAGSAGSDASEAGAGQGGGAGEAGAETAGQGGEAGAGALWNEHSQHVELDCFGFFVGSMLFSADRAKLSRGQLQALENLSRIPPGNCGSDGLGCNVAVTNDRGRVTHYDAIEHGFCEEAIAPLRAELGCKLARESADLLAPSTGCFHGLHASQGAVHQQLSLPEAHRSYRVELAYCARGSFTLELLGPDSSVPLAVGMPVIDPGGRGICIALDVEVEAPMIADLVITPTAAWDGGDNGDFLMSFR